jgi:hypothetical protein
MCLRNPSAAGFAFAPPPAWPEVRTHTCCLALSLSLPPARALSLQRVLSPSLIHTDTHTQTHTHTHMLLLVVGPWVEATCTSHTHTTRVKYYANADVGTHACEHGEKIYRLT